MGGISGIELVLRGGGRCLVSLSKGLERKTLSNLVIGKPSVWNPGSAGVVSTKMIFLLSPFLSLYSRRS